MTEHRRRWTAAEFATLREAYPRGGIRAAREALAGRSDASIRNKAWVLGLIYGKAGRHPRFDVPEHIDAQIRKLYSGPIQQGDTRRLARRLGWSRSRLKHRAQHLGLAVPRERETDWSERELEILADCRGLLPNTVRKRLAAAGYRRTNTAIQVKRKRLKLTGTPDGRYTAGHVGQLLGLDGSTIASYCRRGMLRAERRGTERTHAADDWLITDAAIRQFIIGYPAHIDLRKVELAHSKYWLIDLLTGTTGAKAPGRDDTAGREDVA